MAVEGAKGSSATTTSSQQQQQQQLAKLRDANAKYKNLLKMAKERIQLQQDELEELKQQQEKSRKEFLSMQQKKMIEKDTGGEDDTDDDNDDDDDDDDDGMENCDSLVRVWQRIKVPISRNSINSESDNDDNEKRRMRRKKRFNNKSNKSTKPQQQNAGVGGDQEDSSSSSSSSSSEEDKNQEEEEEEGEEEDYEIWALMEFAVNTNSNNNGKKINSRHQRQRRHYKKKWKRFDCEEQLLDFTRNYYTSSSSYGGGHSSSSSSSYVSSFLPPYSLSVGESMRIQQQSQQRVTQITEEFRRFRVKAEVARQQADASMKALCTSQVQTTKKQMEETDREIELKQARSKQAQLEALRNEMTQQETHWREAYDLLLAENQSLKSSGAEALLAAQWRQRYETCLAEKEDLESKLQIMTTQTQTTTDNGNGGGGKYEMKYRDLKESFRLYRKKAKEIFEAQQRGDVGLLSLDSVGQTEEAKLSYLKNLMVNYLTADVAVREHMEGAIATVLKFSPEDMSKIEKAKKESAQSWFPQFG